MNTRLIRRVIMVVVLGIVITAYGAMGGSSPPDAYAQDSGAEFRAKDDLTVQGTAGTKNDADLEVMGVSSFAGDVFVESGLLATPYGGLGRYENLLTYSDAFDNAAWVKTNVTAPTADQIAAPTGATTAEALAPATAVATNVKITSGTTAAASTPYTFSVWLKTASGTKDIVLTVGDSATNSTATASLTTSWQRFSATYTSSASPTGSVFGQIGDATWTADTIHAWGGQLEQASTAGVYAKAGSSVIAASRGIVSTGDIIMPSLKLSGGTITDTTGAVTVGSDLVVTGDGPHYVQTGNVGIGTTNPSTTLHVEGTARPFRISRSGYSTYWETTIATDSLNFRDGNTAMTPLALLSTTGNVRVGVSEGTPDAHLEVSADGTTGGSILMLSSSDDLDGDLMIVQEDGNVGIGLTNPTSPLHVSGNIALTGTVDGRDLATDGTKLDGIEALADVTDATNVAAAGAVMDGDFTSEGLMRRGASGGTYTIVTDSSSNWNTAYTDRMKWDGGATDLVAATGRTSLGLVIGTNVQAFDADLTDLADGSLTGSKVGTGIAAGNITTGTVSTDRYTAYGDLSAEGYLGDNAATDLTSKSYVDNAIAGLKWKSSVKATTTANAALATAFANTQVIDGVTLATGDRILIKDQTTGSENGIYTVNVTGAPTRATDADSEAELVAGAVFVEQGTTFGDVAFVCSNNTITLETTSLTFVQFTGAQAYTWGDGLTNSGTVISASVDNSTIEINADQLRVKDSGITSAKINDGTIANADVNASAAIAQSKLNLAITDSEVASAAAIAGTKISPNFGSQTVVTTGNVGIGTTGPISIFQVHQNTVDNIFTPALSITGSYNDGEVGKAIDFYVNNTDYRAARIVNTSKTGGNLSFFTSNNWSTTDAGAKMIVTGNGDVGIGGLSILPQYGGTTLPGATLPSGWATDNDATFLEITSESTGKDVGVFLRESDETEGLDLWFDNSANIVYFDSRDDNNAGDIRFRTKTAGTAVDTLAITGTGNVGIGTTAPAQKLEVAGNIALTGTVDGYDISAKGPNWDTAYTDRLKWDGGATGLNATTGRTSLGLGTAATRAAEDTLTNGSNLPDGAAVQAYVTGLGYSTASDTLTGLVRSTSTGASYITGGKVGVGLTNPTADLNIKGNLSTALTGTVSVTAATTAVTGTTTAFDTELAVGDAIKIGSEVFTVSAIGSATSLTLDSNHLAGASGATAYKDSDLFQVKDGNDVAMLTLNSSGDLTVEGTINATIEGTASNANLLDNLDSSQFLRSDLSDSVTTGVTLSVDSGATLDVNGDIAIADTSIALDGASTDLAATGNLSVNTNDLFIEKSSGEVGIGTTSPATALHVTGIIRQDNAYGVAAYGVRADYFSNTANLSLNAGPTTGSILLKAGPSERMRIDGASGNVGIGTTAPTDELHVAGDIRFTGNLVSPDGAVNSPAIYNYNDVDTGIYWPASGEIGFTVNSSEGMRINSNGAVGIATTAPEADLDVAGTLRVATAGDTKIAHDLVMENITSSAINSYGPLTIQSGTSNDNFNLVLKGSGTGKVLVDDDFSATGNIELGDAVADTVTITGTIVGASPALLVNQTAADTIANFQDSGASVLYLADGGNVGIGTTAPGQTLQVNGTVDIGVDRPAWASAYGQVISGENNLLLYASGNPHIKLYATGGSKRPSIRLRSDIAEWNLQPHATTGDFELYNDVSGTVVTIEETGNVGIGTAAPSALLDVAGNTEINGNIAVTGTVDGRDIATDGTKLDGIEALADVTDATNVAAAGAVMDGDFSANGLMKRTGAGAYSVATVTTAGEAILDDADNAAQRTTLGLVIGTDVQAFDADLTDLADGSLTGSKVGSGIAAGNITTGTVSTDRYTAYGDLSAEGYLGDNAATDLTSKSYVDNAIAGLKWKASVKATTTANAALTTAFANTQVIDGVTLATGDRILIKDQTTGSENGIYTVNASGAPTRATDADSEAELVAGAVFVEQGTTYGDVAFVCSNNAITLETTSLTFVQFTGAQAYTWGDGLTNSGTTISANVDNSTIEINADQLRVKDSGITSAKIADGAIMNADINASAAIVDTKLATIATAGKVSDSALSSNVSLLGQTIESAEITDATIANADLASGSFTSITGVGTLGSLTVSGATNLATTSGNVGIGTTGPSYLLDINALGVTNGLRVNAYRQDGVTPTNRLYVSGANGYAKVSINSNSFKVESVDEVFFDVRDPSWPIKIYRGTIKGLSANGGLRFDTDASQEYFFKIGGSDVMHIGSSGSVGIGTTAPAANLNIKGTLGTALTGTVSVTAATTAVTGTSTLFDTELAVGDAIKIGSEVFTVSAIGSATSLTLDSTHTAGASGATAYRDSDLFLVHDGDATAQLTLDKSGTLTIAGNIATTGTVDGYDISAKGPNWDTAYTDRLKWDGGATGLNAATGRTSLGLGSLATLSTVTNSELTAGSFSNITGVGTLGSLNVSGNVGIGTTTTAAKLDIQGNTSGSVSLLNLKTLDSTNDQDMIRLRNSSDVERLSVGLAGNVALIDASTSLILRRAGSNIIRVDSNDDVYLGEQQDVFIDGPTGSVGIATTTPLTKLDVAGSTRIKGTATSVLTGSIDPAASTTVTGVGTAFTTELVPGDRITVTGETRTVTAIASATSLTVDSAFTDNLNDTSPDKLAAELIIKDSSDNIDMIVKDDAKVGIGTAAPTEALHVVGNIYATGTVTGTGGTYADGSGTQNYISKWSDAAGDTLGDSIIYDDGSSVGIGTSSPGDTLEVSGDVRATRIGIGRSPTASYALHINSGKLRFEGSGEIDMSGGGSIGGSGNITLDPSSGHVVLNPAAGNVGIGTTAPQTNLHILGSASPLRIQRGTNTSAYNQWQVTIGADDMRFNNVQTAMTPLWLYGTSGNPRVSVNDQTPDAHFEVSADGGSGGSAFMVSSNDDTDGDLFIVQESGNVGIGITAPSATFEVAGTTKIASEFPVTKEAVGLWHFNQAVTDESSNQQTLTLNGNATYADGMFGRALSLDGATGTYASISGASASNLNLGTTDFLIEAWIKPSDVSTGYKAILTKMYWDAPREGYMLYLHEDNNANLRFLTYDDGNAGGIDAPNNIEQGKWQHVAVTYDGTTYKLYKNGSEINSVVNAIIPESTNVAFEVGRRDSSLGHFPGLIDEVRVTKYPSGLPSNIAQIIAGDYSGAVMRAHTHQIFDHDVKVGTGTFDNASSGEDLYVTGNFEVDGNAYLGDNISVDTLTVNAALTAAGTSTISGDLHVTGDGPHYISAGNVGIGTTNPGNALPNGFSAGQVLDMYGNGVDTGVQLRSNAGGGLDLWQDMNVGTVYIDSRYNNDGGNMYFRTKTTGTPVTAMTIQGDGDVILNTGNVGIGTTAPAQKLDIVGNIALTGTVDGRDIATDGTKLDGIEALADVTDATNVAAAGAVMDGDFSANGLMKRTGAGAYSVATVTTAGEAILDDADNAAQRTTLGLVIGTDVQAFDADLTDLADGSLTGSKVGTGIAAGNITSGTVSTDRYTAYGDLSAEGYLGDNAATDLTSKSYVDNAIAGLKWKASVKATTTANAALATAFANTQVIDGVTLATGDRILIKDQTTGSENGIYTVNASGAPTRATDADSEAELVAGAVFVEQGTSFGDVAFVCSNNAITLETTSLTFVQFTGAQAYTWGTGLSNTGTTINVGAGTGIDVDASNVIHEDMSTQATVDNSAGTVIQDVTMGSLGHVTGLTSVDLDGRYYTETEADSNFVDVGGDTMTGTLNLPANGLVAGTNQLILSGGNVGIGATTPLGKLDVRGDIFTDRWLEQNTNTFIGMSVAGNGSLSNTTGTEGYYNTALGYRALHQINTGYANAALGYNALYGVTSGYHNVAVGRDAGYGITTGSSNLALGTSSGNFGSGSNNTAVGNSAASSASNPTGVVAIGHAALTNASGQYGVGIGFNAGVFNTNPAFSTIVGGLAGQGASSYSAPRLTLIGYKAGYILATGGSNNILIGYQAGDSLTTGANNIAIGYDVELPSNTGDNQMTIGNLIFATGVDGTGTTVSSGNVGIGDTSPAQKLEVAGNIALTGTVDGYDISAKGANWDTAYTDRMKWDGGATGLTAATGRTSLGLGGLATLSTITNSELTAGSFSNITGVGTLGSLTVSGAANLATSSGNVGIGTTSPAKKLDVSGTGMFLSTLTIGNEGSTASLQLIPATGDFYLRMGTTGNYQVFDNPDGQFRFEKQGANPLLSMGYTYGAVFNDNGYAPYDFRVEGNNDTHLLFGDAGEDAVGIGYSSLTGTTGKLLVNGNVGINTTAPLTKLDVAGSTRIKGTATSVLTGTIDPAASTTVTGVGTAFTTELVPGDRITVTGETRTVTAIASATSLTVDSAFSDNANDIAPDKLAAELIIKDSSDNIDMIVKDDGKVGIGTAAPTEALYVDGNIYATGTVTGVGGAYASGAGTQNYISKWSDAAGDTLGDSIIYDDGTSVGIGTTNPGFRLDILGAGANIRVGSSTSYYAALSQSDFSFTGGNTFVRTASNHDFSLGSNNATRIKLHNTGGIAIGSNYQATDPGLNNVIMEGSVGIGTTNPSAGKLQVAGDTAMRSADKVILDSDDTADSYLAHNNAGNYVSFYIDGIECARIKKK